MTLGEFRQATAGVPDTAEIEVDFTYTDETDEMHDSRNIESVTVNEAKTRVDVQLTRH